MHFSNGGLVPSSSPHVLARLTQLYSGGPLVLVVLKNHELTAYLGPAPRSWRECRRMTPLPARNPTSSKVFCSPVPDGLTSSHCRAENGPASLALSAAVILAASYACTYLKVRVSHTLFVLS